MALQSDGQRDSGDSAEATAPSVDLRLDRLTLSFPPAYEAHFRDDYFAKSVRPLRLGLALVAAVTLVYFLALVGLMPETVERGLVKATILFVPLAAGAGLGASYLPDFEEVVQPTLAAILLAIAADVFFYASLYPENPVTGSLGTACTMLLVWFVFGFARLRFPWAVAVSVAMTAGWIAAVVTFGIGADWRLLFFAVAALVLAVFAGRANEMHIRHDFLLTRQLAAEQALLASERDRSRQLLRHALPEQVLAHLEHHETTGVDAFPDVTVLFADIVGFADVIKSASPEQVVDLLNGVFAAFDRAAERFGLEKLKTVGDAYVVVAGLPVPRPDHAEAIADLALELQRTIVGIPGPDGQPLRLRIGISTGPVVAGVIGTDRFAYDIWGEAISSASSMESGAPTGSINVAAPAYERLAPAFRFEEQTSTDAADRPTYLLRGRLAA
jgi:class 3 adenylate cyclase